MARARGLRATSGCFRCFDRARFNRDKTGGCNTGTTGSSRPRHNSADATRCIASSWEWCGWSADTNSKRYTPIRQAVSSEWKADQSISQPCRYWRFEIHTGALYVPLPLPPTAYSCDLRCAVQRGIRSLGCVPRQLSAPSGVARCGAGCCDECVGSVFVPFWLSNTVLFIDRVLR